MVIYANKRSPLARYRQADASEANYATPHRLVQMLMEGALDKIAIARGAIERKDLQSKHDHIHWAIAIIDGLRSGLDFEKGGEVAANLDSLYAYMRRRLTEANAAGRIELLDEVTSLLKEIKDAWDAMPEQVRMAKNAAEIEAMVR
ncbi:MAG: flagellar export chaperone FliS [Gammaproteobacteria bacterium]|nr:flagellar export chaperone FliS [Gammaproteobacteria bacterium]